MRIDQIFLSWVSFPAKTLWRSPEIVVNVKLLLMDRRWAKNISCFPHRGPSAKASADLRSCFVLWNWMFDSKIWLVMQLNGFCHSLTCRHLTPPLRPQPHPPTPIPNGSFPNVIQILGLPLLFFSLPFSTCICSSCWQAESNSYFFYIVP